MQISSIRKLEGLQEVLKDPKAHGPDIAYWVFSDMGHKKWENMTVTTPGLYGDEFPKTYGHYHSASGEIEIYKVISGQGVFLLQKKHVENDTLVLNQVDEVFLIGAEVGDEIEIKADYGHSWSNVGDTPLITFDNWRYGHVRQDYEPIKNQRGMAYYLVNDSNGLKLVANSNYKNLPQPKWVTAKEFKQLSDS